MPRHFFPKAFKESMSECAYLWHEMVIVYSIPVRIVPNNSTLRCTIPKEIALNLGLRKGDELIWILHDDGKLEVRVPKEAKTKK